MKVILTESDETGLECKDTILNLARKKAEEAIIRREEILEAFIAKYGYHPDEMVIYEQPSTGKFWVEKKENQDWKANYEEVKEMLFELMKEIYETYEDREDIRFSINKSTRKWFYEQRNPNERSDR